MEVVAQAPEAAARELERAVRDLLADMRRASNGNLLVTDTGEMQEADQYGAASTLGFELDGEKLDFGRAAAALVFKF